MALRYFNAAGADPDGEIGEDHDPETHLIPLVIGAALGTRPPVKVFGDDYPTPDGTGVRDYIHVMDLADAHLRALERLGAGTPSQAINLGTGQRPLGARGDRRPSARVEREDGAGRSMAPRRAGDPPELVADPRAPASPRLDAALRGPATCRARLAVASQSSLGFARFVLVVRPRQPAAHAVPREDSLDRVSRMRLCDSPRCAWRSSPLAVSRADIELARLPRSSANGVAERALPERWSTTENVRWVVDVPGRGLVVADRRRQHACISRRRSAASRSSSRRPASTATTTSPRCARRGCRAPRSTSACARATTRCPRSPTRSATWSTRSTRRPAS